MGLNKGVLNIDEPAAFLHYDLQTKRLSFLENLIISSQATEKPLMWLATHSPPIIHSVSSDSIFVVDIDHEKNITPFHESEKVMDKRLILQLLDISNYQKEKPVLYMEGTSDEKFIKYVLRKFRPDLLDKWRFEAKKGVDRIEELYEKLIELRKIGKILDTSKLLEYLNLNYFLFDGDNKREEQVEQNTFVWPFYHIENLLFQDPWFDLLKTFMIPLGT
ncbi:MAG: hypothetical protein ACFFBD_30435 [Candidatus Hodarchaeota archaeon]